MVDLFAEYKSDPTLDKKNNLLKANIGLVKSIVGKYSGDFDDLCQIGLITLSRCIDQFDSTKGAFSTYATKSIHNRLINYVTRNKSVATVFCEHTEGSSKDYDLSKLEDILFNLTKKDRSVFFTYLEHGNSPSPAEYKVLSKIKKLL